MPLYLSNPHQVDAMQITDSNYRTVHQWCIDNGYTPEILTAQLTGAPVGFRFGADVSDTEEPQIAEAGEWILRHENGKYEVADESYFEATYSEYRH